jgi:hypothetical protein
MANSEPAPSTPKVLSEQQLGHVTWIEEEASPDDPMFGKLHIAFLNDPAPSTSGTSAEAPPEPPPNS